MRNSVPSLTVGDVERLLVDPSVETRLSTSVKLAQYYDSGHPALGPAERGIAEDIFRGLVLDAELRIREALAANLKANPDIPHDLAASLASDVESVALPILRSSEVLTDEDLVRILRHDSSLKQVAIAGRRQVSTGVAEVLLDTGNERAVARLVGNTGADLREPQFERVITEYKASESVQDSLARRPQLPAAVSEQVVASLAGKLEDWLTKRHNLSHDQASNLVLQTRERATASLRERVSSVAELEAFVQRLHVSGRLSPTLALRVLLMADLSFFEVAMSRMAGVPLANVRRLVSDEGALGLTSLFDRAGMPKEYLPAARAALQAIRESQQPADRQDRETFICRVIQRTLTHASDPTSEMSDDDVVYLVSKLNQLAA